MEEEEDEGREPTFGRVLRMERKRLGLTQTELAEHIGTSQQNVAGWEAGRAKPRREQLQKLIEFLNAQPPEPRNDSEVRPSITAVLQALAMFSGPLMGSALLPGVGPMLGSAVAAAIGGKPAQKRQVLLEDSAHSGGAEPRIHFSRAQEMPSGEWADLCEALPEHLRNNVDRRMHGRTIDYWGPKIMAEVKVVRTPGAATNIAQTGLHQLTVFREMLKRDGEEPPQHVYLIMVMPHRHAASFLKVAPNSSMSRVQEDASLLGIGYAMTPTLEAAAGFIAAAERGELDNDEIDHPSAGSW